MWESMSNEYDVYIIDTSSLRKYYDSYHNDYFPEIVECIKNLIINKRMISHEEVLFELEKRNDDLLAWSKTQDVRGMFEKDPIHVSNLIKVLEVFPDIATKKTEWYHADPWLVAMAMREIVIGKRIVVTEEQLRNNAHTIPYVCKHFGIECIDIIQLLKLECNK